MNKNRRLIFLLILVVFPLLLSAGTKKKNNNCGFGFSSGVTNYMGDLDDNSPTRYTRPGFGMHFIYPVVNYFKVRTALFRGTIGGDDTKATHSVNKGRGLNFSSPITEGSLHFIFMPLEKERFRPFIFLGIGVFKFNPTAEYMGTRVFLHDLGTEGQTIGTVKPYSLTQPCFPVGVGMTFRLTDTWEIGFECGSRRLITDYLDDVSGNYPDETTLVEHNPMAAALSNRTGNTVNSSSMRGDSRHKDCYVYTAYSLTYFLPSPDSKKKGIRNAVLKKFLYH